VATPFLAAVQQVNQAQRMLGIRQLRAALGSLDGKRIAVWGLTFKGETEDIRESPAMDVVSHLVNDGADVIAYDPSQPRRLPERLHLTLAESAMEAVVDADALAILSDWPEFGAVPLQDVRRRMRGDVLFDGRNVLAPGEAHRHGFHSISVGRGRSLDVEAVAR
jgi:UDPglucose 6-dehydrogenase